MAQLADATIRLHADTKQLVRDVNAARRRIQTHTVLLPFSCGVAATVVGFICGRFL